MEMFDIKGFLDSAKRIFIISKKPTWQEYKVMLQVVGIGIIIIGIISYIIDLMFKTTGIGGI